MTDRISKIKVILLVFNVTGYKIARELSPNSPFMIKDHFKVMGFLGILLIEYGLIEFVCGYWLKMRFHTVTLVIMAFMTFHILLDLIYQKTIEEISDSYLTYYNILVPVVFAMSVLCGLVTLFMFRY